MVSGGKKRAKDLRRGSDLRPDGYPHAARTLAWHSCTSHPKSRHEEILQGHALNQQLELCLPGDKEGLALAQSLKWETSFYYEVTTSLAMFLSKRFIAEYVLQGTVYMIAKNVPVDSSNSAMLLPTGELLLLVDSGTYAQLGLVGKKYGHAIPAECRPAAEHARRAQRYVVTLDLKSNTFTSDTDKDKSARERIVSCLETKFAPLEMLVCAYNERGSACTIIFGDDDTIERKRVELNGEWTHFQDIMVPQFEKFYSSLGAIDTSDDNGETSIRSKKEKLVASLQGAYDWFGLVACRLTYLLKQEAPEEYVSVFTGVPDMFEFQASGEIASVRWRGLIASEFCRKNVVEKAAHAVKSGKVAWAAVMVWGFPDALVSWKQKEGRQTREHGYLVNGTNHYTILLLPNEEYFLLQSLGAHDETM
ncbi:Ribonuclease p protein subunit p40, partial [Globisporangium splendens]